MHELHSLALELQELLEARSWEYCIIGGIAVQHWGEPRLTRDLDLTLFTGFGGEEPFVDALLAKYEGRRPDAREFALLRRVVLLCSPQGLGIDVSLGGLDFEQEAVSRARKVEVEPGAYLRLCTAEDLLVLKAFANRDRDWPDIRGILIRQGVRNLDWSHIFKHLRGLCELKEEPEIVDHLQACREKLMRAKA